MNEMIKNVIKKTVITVGGINNWIKIKSNMAFRKDKELEKELMKNKEFKNMYVGKRCFILGNGPSLKTVDFNILKDEIVFTVNQLPRDPRFKQLHSNFHFWADRVFWDLDRDRSEDMELLKIMESVNDADNSPIVFYKYAAKEMIEEYSLKDYLNIRYYDETWLDHENIPNMTLDFTKLVPEFNTVVHYIICLAVYMGFSEIVLLGCDCTGFISLAQTRLDNAGKALYTYAISENEKKRMKRVQTLASFRDELFWQVGLFDDYLILNQYCKNHGVKLYNATDPTLLETIEKVNLEEYLCNSK